MKENCYAGAAAPVIEAHRGDSAHAPENTIVAFRQAIDLGAGWIELDIHQCAGGDFVVMHDTTVDRTSDGEGAIADLTLAQLRSLDIGAWRGAQFAGERIPTLRETLELVQRAGVHLNIEIKELSQGETSARQLAALLDEYPSQDGLQHVVSSFNLEALLDLDRIGAEVPLAYLGGKEGFEILQSAMQHGLPWVHLQYEGVSRDLVLRAHAAGIRVMVWTMDRGDLYAYFARAGVDKICTNDPGRMLRIQQAGK
ncbi:MAG: hypothetical protein KAI66_22620 [Lentisphaeria bacterium]|nr:hypothetical protein [Lentisphaeria bacterium]